MVVPRGIAELPCRLVIRTCSSQSHLPMSKRQRRCAWSARFVRHAWLAR